MTIICVESFLDGFVKFLLKWLTYKFRELFHASQGILEEQQLYERYPLEVLAEFAILSLKKRPLMSNWQPSYEQPPPSSLRLMIHSSFHDPPPPRCTSKFRILFAMQIIVTHKLSLLL